MCLNTALIWFGCFAFNGASTANLSLRSIYVVVNTNLAGCGGGVGWVLIDYLYEKNFSLIGFYSGIMAGLVGITPVASYIPIYVTSLIGFLTSTCCCYAVKYKHILFLDDGLDIFALHSVGGYIGDLLTGIFADNFVSALNGVSGNSYTGGWWKRNFRQLGLGFAGATTAAAWSFLVSCMTRAGFWAWNK